MRSWLVIPVMGAACAAAALALGAPKIGANAVIGAIAAGLAGAAMADAVRALAGESAAALAGAAIAPLLAVVSIAERGGSLAVPGLALAAIAWTVAELARPPLVRGSPGSPTRPLLALAPAAAAAILAPAAAGLVALAAARLALDPGPRASPRIALAAVLAGAALAIVALAAGVAHRSGFAELWFGAPARPISPAALAARAGDALGPLAALAALAGLAGLVAVAVRGGIVGSPRAVADGAAGRTGRGPRRRRFPELALAACVAGALLADLRAGAIGPLTLGLAALAAGLAAGRFAAQIRLPAGQAVAGATIGLFLLLPPAWTAAQGHRGAIASR